VSSLGPSLSIDGDSTGCASCAALRARCQKLEADMACRNQLRARVAELEAELERLRESLQVVVDAGLCLDGVTAANLFLHSAQCARCSVVRVARAALEEK